MIYLLLKELLLIKPCFLQDVIEPCLTHFEDSLRILGLDVLISSHSTREDFSVSELDLIRKTVDLSMVLQNSADKQQMITVMKKLILRIKAAMFASSRLQKMDRSEENRKYVEFVQTIFEFFFDCLFENASFSRRSIALECIHDIVMHLDDIITVLKNVEKAEKIVTFFHDSYEHNKNLALEILKTFPDDFTRLKNHDCVQDLLEETLELTRSYKPPDSITAGY